MDYKDRINLRVALLKGLYNDYFTYRGNESKITLKLQETEKQLALHYLADKQLVSWRQIKKEPVLEFILKITTKGIDAVENEIPLSNI